MNRWFAFYTKSRQEKKVRNVLQRRGFEVFLPLQKTVRQWSDRKKKVEVPLFNSYIFVKIPEHQITKILQVPGIAWSIRHNGSPAFLREQEYELIERFLATGLFVEVISQDTFEAGDSVIVADGPLKGVIGRVAAKYPGKLTVWLETLGQVIRMEIEPGLLKHNT
jgi:transcription termination/antitermination protein NusG